ncbi:hypothetical protein ACFL1Y_00025 [Patescibacteria group bacterium]
MPKAKQKPKTEEAVDTGQDNLLCECCKPPKPLVPKMDMGQNEEGKAKIAICLYHKPKSVYVLDDAGNYQLNKELELDGNQIVNTKTGEPFVQPVGPPNLSDLEQDDEPPSSDEEQNRQDIGDRTPQAGSTRTDLEQDGFYRI